MITEKKIPYFLNIKTKLKMSKFLRRVSLCLKNDAMAPHNDVIKLSFDYGVTKNHAHLL